TGLEGLARPGKDVHHVSRAHHVALVALEHVPAAFQHGEDRLGAVPLGRHELLAVLEAQQHGDHAVAHAEWAGYRAGIGEAGVLGSTRQWHGVSIRASATPAAASASNKPVRETGPSPRIRMAWARVTVGARARRSGGCASREKPCSIRRPRARGCAAITSDTRAPNSRSRTEAAPGAEAAAAVEGPPCFAAAAGADSGADAAAVPAAVDASRMGSAAASYGIRVAFTASSSRSARPAHHDVGQ